MCGRRTLTVYTDVRRVTSALDLTRVDTIAIFVVERDGTVLWRGEGGFDPQTAASLARALDERMGSAPDAATRVEQFEFAFDARFRPLLAVLGVTPSTAHITVTTDRLVARFGPWSCDTAIANVVCAGLTGPHAWYKAIGARGSFADRGLTFGTNTRLGVCLEFREAVRGLMPFGLFRHPGLTLTLADRERFVTLVRQRAGLDNAVSAGKPTRS